MDAAHRRAHAMADRLGRLLDRAAGARQALPHLAALECGLREQGLDGIARIPPKSLVRLCTQLAGLPMASDDGPLFDLRSCLEAARDAALAAARAPQAAASVAGTAAEMAVDSADLVVAEVSHSAFMAALEERAATR